MGGLVWCGEGRMRVPLARKALCLCHSKTAWYDDSNIDYQKQDPKTARYGDPKIDYKNQDPKTARYDDPKIDYRVCVQVRMRVPLAVKMRLAQGVGFIAAYSIVGFYRRLSLVLSPVIAGYRRLSPVIAGYRRLSPLIAGYRRLSPASVLSFFIAFYRFLSP